MHCLLQDFVIAENNAQEWHFLPGTPFFLEENAI